MTVSVTRLRPNVLAHPSPTTGRFLLLIAALLGVGLLAGQIVHNGVFGDRWAAEARACLTRADAAVPDQTELTAQIEHTRLLTACLAPADRLRTVISVAGAVVIALLGFVVLALIPAYLRRRRKLRAAGPRLDGAVQRIGELARQAGLRKPPRLLLGPAGQRDAFVFGLPGRYFMVLPTALVVRWRSPDYFDPVVRHELAHLKRHDVTLAWLASAVWLAALPVAVLPVVVALVSGDFSLLWAYLWRAAVVMAAVWAIRRQALRSREHDADLHAARQAGDWRPLCTVLETGAAKPKPNWWRRFVSHHPAASERIAILVDPGRVRGVSVVDGLAGGFLTALLLPMVASIGFEVFNQTPLSGYSTHIAALLVGPVAGLAVGVGLWRQAMIDHVTGGKLWPGAAVFGFAAGLLLGHWTSLRDLGLTGDQPFGGPLLVLFGAAAVLLSAATGRLWADASGRLPGPGSWWVGLVVNGLIFATALWAAQWLPMAITTVFYTGFGVDALGAIGALAAQMVLVPLLPVIVAMGTMVRRRHRLPLAPWLAEGAAAVFPVSARRPGLGISLLGGVAAGVTAALGSLAYRMVVGSPVDDADRIARYGIWLALGVITALAVSFVTIAVVPRSGGAVGSVTGLVAAVVAPLGTLLINTFVFGNILDPGFYLQTIATVVALWVFGYLLLLPVTLAVWPATWRDVPGSLLAALNVIGAAVVTLSVVGLAIALR